MSREVWYVNDKSWAVCIDEAFQAERHDLYVVQETAERARAIFETAGVPRPNVIMPRYWSWNAVILISGVQHVDHSTIEIGSDGLYVTSGGSVAVTTAEWKTDDEIRTKAREIKATLERWASGRLSERAEKMRALFQ